MEYKKPEQSAVPYWRVKRCIGLFILVSVLGLATFFLTKLDFFAAGTPARTLLIALVVIISILQLVSIVVLPAIEFRQWEYAITDDRVVIKHGIFFITKSIIPIIRIQNVTTNQGPVQRWYDLYNVELALASGTFDVDQLLNYLKY